MLLNLIQLETLGADSLIMAFVGYFIVFFALVLLYQVFFFVPKILNIKVKKKEKTTKGQAADNDDFELTGEVNAAISMALYLHFNQYHDEESREMTIKRESRIYSPWSSKIYQVRNQFNRL